jgi:CspA family cold shock protein
MPAPSSSAWFSQVSWTTGKTNRAMSFDRGRRGDRGGRGRDKRDGFGGDDFGGGFGGGFEDRGGFGGGDRFGGGGGGYRGGGGGFGGGGGGGGYRGGGGGGFGGGGGGGGFGGGRGGGMPPQVVGEGTGVVKFFNSQKGFGFVVRDDGGEDVFVHISAVEQAGLTGLAEGQPLGFTLVDRGGRISATDLKIDGEPMPVQERAPREDRGGAGGGFGGERGGPQRQLTGEKATGTVKFFNAMKGFGFIQRDDGQPDAFVHISAVERAGMPTLNEGDRLEFELEVDRRGKYAAVNLQAAQ